MRMTLLHKQQDDEIKQEINEQEKNQRIICTVQRQQYQNFHELLDLTREEELERLSKLIIHHLPTDDTIARIMIEKLKLLITDTCVQDMDIDSSNQRASSSSSSTIFSHPYPPENRIGQVKDHDRPYADYGHLGLYRLFCFSKFIPFKKK